MTQQRRRRRIRLLPRGRLERKASPIASVPPSARDQIAKQITADAGSGNLIAQLSANPFFTAGFGLAGLGAAIAVAQKGVRQAASLLKRRLLVDVEISRNDESYQWFLHWMSRYHSAQLSHSSVLPSADHGIKPTRFSALWRRLVPGLHHLSIQTSKISRPNGSLHTQFSLVPGPGRHILRYRNAFIAVTRSRETKTVDIATGTPWETVTLTTLYAHRHIFEHLFTEAHALAAQLTQGKTTVYTSWGTEWRPFGQARQKRPLDSVILDRGVKERILADVQDFLASDAWYHDRGIPYRRGYLLHGPPGTGKSSFIQALAGELDYNISLLNLSERGLTDDRLNHLLTIIPSRTLVLLEDVDAAFTNRRHQVDRDGYRGANVTFSGLLNALDGVASAEERIVFLTTNHVERLDAALVRPGRVDMTVRLGEATRWQIEQLWDRFYADVDVDGQGRSRFLHRLEALGMVEDANGRIADPARRPSTAALQGLFLFNKGDVDGAIAMAEGLVDKPQAAELHSRPDDGMTHSDQNS
ncbi:MAG: hypothetical protein M1838_002531 [Thelocarpon superellum]|nr:MAG: hypothetical protein M1838_002531 [Thelocarpon superellum]